MKLIHTLNITNLFNIMSLFLHYTSIHSIANELSITDPKCLSTDRQTNYDQPRSKIQRLPLAQLISGRNFRYLQT